jgi:predicted Zn-dependent protease
VRWGVPAAADATVALVPHSIEAQMGDHALAFFDEFVLEESTLPAERRKQLEALFAELAAVADEPPGRLRLLFRGGARIGPNAFALPGGQIIITDTMVLLARDDDEIAGVLGHEIGHVEERHGVKLLLRAAGLTGAVVLITGDASSLLEDASMLPLMLLHFSYARDFEREADARSTALLRATGRSPAALAALFERLTAACEPRCVYDSWVSTHPAPAERIEALRRAAAEAAP